MGGGRRCGLSAAEALEDATEGGPLDGAAQGLPLPEKDLCGVDQPLVPTCQQMQKFNDKAEHC